MKAKVDQDLCVGCGLCVNIAPEVFSMSDDKAAVIAAVPADAEEKVKEAAESCPVEAIFID